MDGQVAGERVLIAGRQAQVTENLRRRLTAARARPVVAGDPAAALSLAAAAAQAGDGFALLALDGDSLLDGDFALFQRICDMFGAPRIPIVVIGGDGGHRAAGVVQTPGAADDDALIKAIDQALGGAIPPEGAAEKQMRILLAEDNQVNQLVAVGLLSSLGYSADVAPNGAEAVAAMERDRYDLVLMDVRMPVMDGLEATRRIRALPGPAASVPIVAVTANAMRGDEEACLGAGMNDYLAKPIRLATLDAALKRWLPHNK